MIFLNEINPLAHLRLLRYPDSTDYCPTDLCKQLSLSHNGSDPTLAMAAFAGSLSALLSKTSQQGHYLVARSHDHVDFFVGAMPLTEFSVDRAMRSSAELLAVLTIRHPLDSWLSLLQANWHRHLDPCSLDEFCRRCLVMIDAAATMPVFYYEHFVSDPRLSLLSIAAQLELEGDEQALHTFTKVRLSGASGRQSSVIEPRSRRPLDRQLQAEILSSENYDKLCARLAYHGDPEAPFPYLIGSSHPGVSFGAKPPT